MSTHPACDKAAFEQYTGGVPDALLTSLRSPGLRGGGQRPAWDLQLCASSWGSELQHVQMRKGRMML